MGTWVPISPNNAVERFDRAILKIVMKRKLMRERKADDNLPFSDIKAWGM